MLEFEAKHILEPYTFHKLTQLLREYHNCVNEVQSLQETITKLQSQAQERAKRLWLVENKSKTLQAKCGDGIEINHTFHYNTGQFQVAESAKLSKLLYKLRSDANTLLYRKLYENKMAKIQVQEFIDRFLCESKVFGKSVAIKSEQLGNYPYLDIQHRPEQANIKELLDILFHFERHFTQLQRSQNGTAEIAQQHVGNELKSSAAPIAILDDVHGWIVQLSIPYIKFSDLVDRRYIFQHLMFTPGIENWAKDILAYLVSSEQSRLVEIEIATIVEMLGYVTMLKKSGSNIQQPTTTVSSLLWEEDYSAFLDQIAIPERLNDAVDRAILNDSVNLQPTENIGDLVYPVTLANDYFQCLNDILLQFSKSTYTVLLKRLAQTICQLSHTIGRLVIGHNQRNLRNEEAGTLQTEADSLVIKTFRCYLSLPNIGVRYFLSSVPVRFVSVEGLWNIVSEVFRIAPNPKVDFPTIAFDIDHFCQLLLTNAGEGVFLLQCLGNISLVIEPQEQLIGGQTEYSTRQQIILAIAYVFFHVAYLNDTMRDTFYKDVRDTYEMMCGRHPLLISSLLKWTVNDFDKIGNNALYLFRSLNLAEWHITQEDIGSLQQLLCSGESSELGLNFTKYIIENLNYSYKDEVESEPHSRAKPWEKRNVPFLPYSIHSEVAFMILGIAQRIQPTAEMFERTVATTSTEALTYAIAPYIPTANDAFVSASDIKRRQYMDWCWGIILRLQLFECPMQERATEIDESISKIGIGEHARMSNDLIGSNLCLIVYTAFMLSSTSRNFLRFDMNRGWEKIQLMLRGNHGDAIIHMFANVVPGFAYMHGDDFFNHGFTSQLLDQILNAKVDASLTEASKSYMKPLKSNLQILLPNNGLQVIVGSHAWMGKKIDLADSLAEQGGFSYLDLILHSWIKIICMQPDWMWKPNRISLLNYIAKLAFTNRRHDIIRGMLEIESERLELLRRSSSSNPSKTGHESPRNPVRFMKSVLADATYPSLLTGEWSMMTLASSSLFKTPNVEQHFFYFAFEALLQETIAETKTRKQLALQLKVDVATRKFKDDMEINSVVKRSGINLRKSVEFFTVYRWLQHILIMPFDHNLLPLFLQMFFSLYFCNIGSDEEKFNFFYGHLFFSKRENLIDQLKKLLAQLKDMPTHTDSKEITVNLDQDQSMKEKQSLYHAMYLWLGDARLQADTDVIDGLPAAYLPSRLTRCRMLGRNLSDPRFKPKNLFDGDTLWMDLVCLNHLVMEFDDFPWVSKVSIHQPVLPVSRPGSSIDVRPHTPIKGSHSALNMAIPSIKLKRPVTALPLAEILELSPQDLFGDMLRILHTHARQFDQLSIQHKSLDSAYLKKLENLYLNKKATSTFQVPCKKVPEGICRKPATFHLDQQELQVEEDVENQLSDNRNQVSNLVVTHIDPRICVQSLQALTTMTEMTKLDDDQISAAQSRKACEAVIFLFEAFRDSASEFPPAKLLSRQFAQMAASSFRLHPELTDTLIQHMGMDDRYINLLYPAFEPMSQPSQFVDLYKKICLSNDYSCAGQLKLISKFDVVKWVNTDQGSSKHQRLLWYEVAFEAIKKLGRTSNDRPQERALSYRHSSLAVKLLRSAYEKYAIDYEYVDVLSLIIKTYSSKPMNTYHLRAFMEFLGIPLDFIRRAISPGQQNKDISLNTLDRDGLIRILGVIIDTWSKVNHNCLDYLYNSAGSLYDLLLACLCDGRLTLDAPEEIVKSSALRFVFDAHRPLMMSGSANRSKEFDQVAEGFLMTVKTIIASRNSKIDTITILEQCLDYYISLQSSTESQWMKILQRDLLQLPWKDMTPNAQVLSTLLKTSEKLAQSSDDSYLAYQHFVTRLLLEWPANNELLEQSSDTLRLYTKLHFIVLQHIEEAELDGQEVIKVLNASVLTCIPQVSSDKEFVEEIQHSLRTSWPTPLESFKPLMDATNGHMQSLHYCLLWFRTLTKIDTPESCTLKLALEYITYVTSLLSSFIESPGINFTNNAIPDVIIDIITALDTMSTREELETKLDILVPALGDIISLLNRCSPNSEEYTAIRNAIMDTIEKLNNIPIAVLHVASLHSIRPYTAAILIEKCVQQELATSRKSIDETWTLISKHLQVLRGDTDDLLHQCLENFCILTLYGRCVAELLLCKTYADECKIAEEVAAFLSITTVPLIVASETTKLVLLLSQFADIFSKKNQDTKLEEFELLAALVSVHRTLYQWAEGKDSHHIAQTGLMSSFGDKWRNGNSSAISIEWKLYSRLLCGFIGRHLAPLTISQSGLTNRPSAIESWQEWIDNTYKIKEYTQYSEKTAKGFELCQNAPIYQLDKVVRSLAHEIFQEVNGIDLARD